MSQENIGGRVAEIIADRLQVDQSDFDEDTEFDSETLDAESLDMVEIAEAVELDVGVHIPDDDLAELETVGQFTEYVREHA